MITAATDRVVGIVRYGYRRRAWLSALGLVMVLVVATAYLLFGALRVNPLASSYRLTVELLGIDEGVPGNRELVQATLDLVRGLGLANTITDDARRRAKILDRWAEVLEKELP